MAEGFRGVLAVSATLTAGDERTLQAAASLVRVAVEAALMEAGASCLYGVAVGLSSSREMLPGHMLPGQPAQVPELGMPKAEVLRRIFNEDTVSSAAVAALLAPEPAAEGEHLRACPDCGDPLTDRVGVPASYCDTCDREVL